MTTQTDTLSFEQSFNKRNYLIAIATLVLQIPVMALVGWHYETGVLLAIGISFAILIGPALAWYIAPQSLAMPISIAIASICFSGLIIHLGRGMIEMHFHIFVTIGALIILASRLGIITAALTGAIHHLAFFFFLPASLFNYDASLQIVLLHATFVVAISIPAFYISGKYRSFIIAQGIIAEHLNGIAGSVRSQSTTLQSSSREIADGANAQAASAQECRASLEEVTVATQNNEERAQNAQTLALQARKITEEGSQYISAMNSAMTEIRESSDSIALIIKSIDEIAFQTNILALNAAVEAARAGDAGAGFSVVAEEVRNLAQRSAKAAKETSERIEQSVSRSQNGAEISKQVADQLDHVLEITIKVAEIVTEISRSSSEQNRSIQLIKNSVTDIDRVTQQSVAMADSNERETQRLEELSDNLADIMRSIETVLNLAPTDRSRSFDDDPRNPPHEHGQDNGDSFLESKRARSTVTFSS